MLKWYKCYIDHEQSDLTGSAFGVYQNSDRFKVKFSNLGGCHGVRTVNIATL